jgi:hypothetical protein
MLHVKKNLRCFCAFLGKGFFKNTTNTFFLNPPIKNYTNNRLQIFDRATCLAVVGYCRCFCCSSLLSVLSRMWMRLYYRVMLLSELDAAGHTDALETPLLLSSDSVIADVELDQGPHIEDGVGKSGNP